VEAEAGTEVAVAVGMVAEVEVAGKPAKDSCL
jgi:hypothetical protein